MLPPVQNHDPSPFGQRKGACPVVLCMCTARLLHVGALAHQEQASSGDSSGLPCLSCCNKTPLTGWIIKDRDLFLRVSKAERLRSGCQPGQVLVKAFFHVADCSLCPHRTEGELASCLAASFQGTSPIHEGSTLMT